MTLRTFPFFLCFLVSAACTNAGKTRAVLSVTSPGSGTIASGEAKVVCEQSGSCTASAVEDVTVTLRAEPAAGQRFLAWSGCAQPDGDRCQVQATETPTITAGFAPLLFVQRVTPLGQSTPVFYELFTVGTDGSEPRQLSRFSELGFENAIVYRAAWAPDGRKIAFVLGEGTELHSKLGKLYWLDVTEADPSIHLVAENIGRQSADSGVAWSHGSDALFHTIWDASIVHLRRASLTDEGGTAVGPEHQIAQAVLSLPWRRMPAEELLFLSNLTAAGDGTEDYLLNAWRDGQRLTNLSPRVGTVTGVTRDGSAAFFAGAGALSDKPLLYRVALESGTLEPLVSVVGQTVLSPDERFFAIASRAPLPGTIAETPGHNIWIAGSDGSDLRPLTKLAAAGVDPKSIEISADGKTIWALSDRALDGSDQTPLFGPANIWAFDVEQETATPITHFTESGQRIYELD